ncbi:hypothetical protein TNCV_1437731 [Trichonephila clavipes]|nr:hypothetical protein TNCV_1437731 [Trichonephila clavipes]
MPKIQTCISCTAVKTATAELRYDCITLSFLIDKCRITEFFSGCIVNVMKRVRSTSPDMIMVNEELYAVQALQALNPADYLLRLPMGGTAMCVAAGLHSSCV